MTYILFFIFLGAGYLLGRLHPRSVSRDIFSEIQSEAKKTLPKKKVHILKKKILEDPNYPHEQDGDTGGA